MSEQQADYSRQFSWAADYCSRAEKCDFDVKKKLTERSIEIQTIEKIISKLIEERYLDNLRYAKAFVREKFQLSKWGRIKIRASLKLKRIDNNTIETALEEINDEQYQHMLNDLIVKKRKTIKDADAYSVKAKLLRFAAGRGFEPDLIFRILGVMREN
jgi:regulatory protein